MDKDISNILCTKVDEHAGDWPSESFLELFRIAKKCVEPKMSQRPEIDDVSQSIACNGHLICIVNTQLGGAGIKAGYHRMQLRILNSHSR